jgi:hypothetical protein
MHTPHAAPTVSAEALRLIAHGTNDDKLRFITERDPDWFVHQVLVSGRRLETTMLDDAVLRLATVDEPVAAVLRHAS